MNKPKLLQGIVIGAIAGGVVSLFDPSTRRYVGTKITQSRVATQHYVKHPTEAFHQLTKCYESWSSNVTNITNQALSILSQVQDTLETVQNDNRNEEKTNTEHIPR